MAKDEQDTDTATLEDDGSPTDDFEKELAAEYTIDEGGSEAPDDSSESDEGAAGKSRDSKDEDDKGGSEEHEPAIGDALLARAKEELGFSKEDAEKFGSSAALEAVLARVTRRVGEAANRGNSGGDKPDTNDKPDDKTDSDAIEFKPPSLEGFDQEFVEYATHLNQTVEKMLGQIGLLNKGVGNLDKQSQAQQGRQAVAAFDVEIAKLGDKYHELLGEGDSDSLRESHPNQYDARGKVAEAYIAIRQGYVQRGKTPPSRAVLIRHALVSEYPDTIKAAATKKSKGADAHEDATQTLSEPSERRSKQPQGEKTAGDWASKFYRSKGMDVDGDDGTSDFI